MGIQDLVRWRNWKKTVQTHCSYTVNDRSLCNESICPCQRKKMGEWMRRSISLGGIVRAIEYMDRREDDA